MTSLNPELERNLWLEFNRHRLIATPVLIGLLFLLLTQIGFHDDKLSSMAMTFFLLFMFLWGGHKTAEAVLEEINDNTWDFQRLSSQSAWSLTWGKLIGSTCFVWYGGLMLLAMYIFSSVSQFSLLQLLQNISLLLLSALICHTAALLSSLQAARQVTAARTKIRIINHHVLGLLAGGYIAGLIPNVLGNAYSITWYGQSYNYLNFMTCLSFFAFFWLLLGVYWQMRAQLHMRTGPIPWIGFVFFIMLLYGGFSESFMGTSLGSFFAFLAGIVLFYFILFVEAWNGIIYRQIQESWKKGGRFALAHLYPRWLLTLAMAGIAGVIFIALNISEAPRMVWCVVAIFCFAVRDVGVLHYFRLGTTSRRPQSVAILYLLILYGLIPWLLNALSLHWMMHLFLPWSGIDDGSDGMVVASVSAIVQSVIVWHMTRSQWQRYWQAL